MELSPEGRKRAVEAFKQEFKAALIVLRNNLAQSPFEWHGADHKKLLHRLKGGAGFLGYTHLTIVMVELENNALTYPSDPQKWLEILDGWESELSQLL